jgi:NAD(P)H-quinone oxidoreductase subunit 5
VHLGAFLLLRFSPFLDQSIVLRGAVILLGLATAILAVVAGRVQSDVKSALSYASLTQVGLIVSEIGFGLSYLALVHLLGHACLRTLQFLRAPTLLQDYRTIENQLGSRLVQASALRPDGFWSRLIPERRRVQLYRLAFLRWNLDSWLSEGISEPFLNLFRLFDSWERRWTDLLAGGPSRESERVKSTFRSLEELI